jgi:hypothetical protein
MSPPGDRNPLLHFASALWHALSYPLLKVAQGEQMAAWTQSGDYRVADATYSNPAVTALADGGYVVAWVSQNPEGGDAGAFAVLAQRFDAAGYKVGPELVLNEPLPLDWIAPRIQLDGTPDGGFVAAWTSELPPQHSGSHDFYGADVYMRRFDPNGTPMGDPTLVNDAALTGVGSANADLHVVALATGGVLVSWIRSSASPTLQVYDAAGNPVGGALEPPVGYADEFLADASGGFYAVRSRSADAENYWIEYQHFGGSGEALGEPVFALPLVGLQFNSPVTATVLADGDLLIARASIDVPAGALYLSLLRHDETTGADEVTVMPLPHIGDVVYEGVIDFQAVALDDGGFVVSWTEMGSYYRAPQIVAQRFDATAQPVGEPVGVKDSVPEAFVRDYDIAAAGDGGFIVTWETDFGTYIERFGPDVAPSIPAEASEEMAQLYVSMFGRAPDGEGLAFWAGLLRSGHSTADVANMMFDTAPARAYYPGALSHEGIVHSFYVNVLGREPDAEGLAFWTDRMELPGASTGSVIDEIIGVVAGYAGADPAGLESAALFENRVTVGQYYGEHNASVAAAVAAMDGVTSDPATVVAAIARLDIVGASAA